MAAIEVSGLTKRWGDFTAVDDLSLSVAEGECYAFLGRNGAGKSTTARMMLDFINPTSGSIKLLGGKGSDPAVRGRIGYLPGDLNLPKHMTGNDAIEYFGSLGKKPDKDVLEHTMTRLDVNRDRPFHQMSTGNRRKIGLALAFMTNPDLLILDEPTSGLDPVLQDTFREMLNEHKAKGTTIWITSHVMSDVEHVADRVGLIDKGKLAQEMSMDELHRQSTGSIELTFASPPDKGAFDNVENVDDVSVDGNEVTVHVDGAVTALLARAAELGATGIRTHQRELDDLFLQTYAGKETGR